MERADIVMVIFGSFGVLWGLVQSLWKKDERRREITLEKLTANHAALYEKLIETQQKNTDSSNRLSGAVDRLAQTVSAMEHQATERHNVLNSRINDLHESEELLRLRMHWVLNKLTVFKFAFDKLGHEMKGDWDAP